MNFNYFTANKNEHTTNLLMGYTLEVLNCSKGTSLFTILHRLYASLLFEINSLKL